VGVDFQGGDLEMFDTFMFSRPHASQGLVEAVKQCVDANKRVVVDLDEDFHHIPPGYPGYDSVGPGNPQALSRLDECLELAGAITLTSQGLAQGYHQYDSKISVVPHSWDPSNPMWVKPAQPRKTLNLGVIATHTHPVDVAVLGDSLAQVMQDFPDTLLVTGFGMELYESFPAVPEDRKLFLPAGRLEDYPYVLSNFDILLFPFIDHPYNHSRSDLPLIEAGARRIPWVATPVSGFEKHVEGGMFARSGEDWYSRLVKLIENPLERNVMGIAGREEAKQNDAHIIHNQWESVLNSYK
jgi:glycosyltransferase involved in cell wall biosynthesis